MTYANRENDTATRPTGLLLGQVLLAGPPSPAAAPPTTNTWTDDARQRYFKIEPARRQSPDDSQTLENARKRLKTDRATPFPDLHAAVARARVLADAATGGFLRRELGLALDSGLLPAAGDRADLPVLLWGRGLVGRGALVLPSPPDPVPPGNPFVCEMCIVPASPATGHTVVHACKLCLLSLFASASSLYVTCRHADCHACEMHEFWLTGCDI